MSYKITITETRTVKKICGKDWAVVGTKEVEREASFVAPMGADEPKTRIEEIRGYTPEIEKNVSETVEILSQSVETLNLPEVIKAINGMGRKVRKPRK